MRSPTRIELVAKTVLEASKRIFPCLETEEPIPFEEVYLPFVHIAPQKLIAKVGTSWQLLCEAVHISLERQLLSKLASVGIRSLELEFSKFKAQKQSTAISLTQQQSEHSNVQYQTFIKDLKAQGLLSFFQKYSVLARLVATTIDFWVEEKAEFLQRLASDLPTMQQTFQEKTGQLSIP